MTKTKTKIKLTKKEIAARLILLAANLLFFLTVWFASKYDRISLDQVLYQIKSSSAGAPSNFASSIFVRVILTGVALTVAELLLCRRMEERIHKVRQVMKRHRVSLAAGMLVLAVLTFTLRLDLVGYVTAISTNSSFIEDYYVEPSSDLLTFPEQKRNLIYIVLESMENTYADTSAEPVDDNYIQKLTQLAEENINFSHTDGQGGALSFNGTTWTAASLVSQTAGITVKVPVAADDYNGVDPYMPGVTALGDLLAEAGYEQVFLLGSDADFAGRDAYFTEHGGYEIVDIKALKEQGRLDEDYYEWWGFEDEKLYEFAKEELLKLAESGQPFNFTMLTADSHFPDGYLCPQCGDTYEEQYANVLTCTADMLYDFVLWIQQQPFYENTTIVISGDHLTMDPGFLAGLEEDYVRTVYNCILNAPIEPVQEKNRLFGVYDMLPTTLAALGVEIAGDRLALGTNLFSAVPTLTEKYGYEFLNDELEKRSVYYNEEILEES